jgi:hypothetical protein
MIWSGAIMSALDGEYHTAWTLNTHVQLSKRCSFDYFNFCLKSKIG